MSAVNRLGTSTSLRHISGRLTIPLVVAPMLHVSGEVLVWAARAAGVVGAFPTVNARTTAQLDEWLSRFDEQGVGANGHELAPYCPNLIMRHPRMREDLTILTEHSVEMVITSVGSPVAAIEPLHDVGCLVFADVATLAHARKALDAGVDGLVLLTAGAGGQTGWINPFAFVRAIREFFDGPLILAGGMSDGVALYAAETLGCDLAYMGTKFLATDESLAGSEYKDMLVDASLDDIQLTSAFTGIPASILTPAISRHGLDPNNLDESVNAASAADRFSNGKPGVPGPKRWVDIWSAGHSVSGIYTRSTVAEVVAATRSEYESARRRSIAGADTRRSSRPRHQPAG